MQLAVDIGNTRVKTGLFKGEELLTSSVSTEDAVFAIKRYFDEGKDISAIVISSVRKDVDAETIPIPETIHHLILDAETSLPFENKYETPNSLGNDRKALAAAALALFPKRNCLVIDAGTCLTMDIVTKDGKYLGGTISPGINMRLRSMHEGTANLPLVTHEMNMPDLIGRNTMDCMKSGAVNGLVNEINGTISRLKDDFDDLQILLTGGDSPVFENELKMGIFADPNLVLRGLNRILLFNLQQK